MFRLVLINDFVIIWYEWFDYGYKSDQKDEKIEKFYFF